MDLWIRLFKCAATMCTLVAATSNTGAAAERWLKLSDNERFLVHADGRPFFYLGDTAWELFHRLDREEADRYLQDRADDASKNYPPPGKRLE